MEKLLSQLVSKLRKALGGDVVSVILYGSAADPAQHDPGFSDVNILCVLRTVTARELHALAPVIAWWRSHELAPPLFMAKDELEHSTDCYAIEFSDMVERRRILFGEDPITGLHVDPGFHRVQVEYELRSKLMRLRHKAAEVLGDRKLLTRLLLDSVTTFCLLIRHALILGGFEAPTGRRQALAAAEGAFGVRTQPLVDLLDVREKRVKASALHPEKLLDDYLRLVQTVISAVNAMAKPAIVIARGDQ